MSQQAIHFERRGEHQEVAVIRLTRPAKRNALNDGLILAIRKLFENMPEGVRAAVIDGDGEHFCAGLDLSELKDATPARACTTHACGTPRWNACSTDRCR